MTARGSNDSPIFAEIVELDLICLFCPRLQYTRVTLKRETLKRPVAFRVLTSGVLEEVLQKMRRGRVGVIRSTVLGH